MNTIFCMTNMKFKYYLFDLDGTVTDTKQGITKSVEYALESIGEKVENLDDLLPFIGPPLRDSFQKYYSATPELAETLINKYRERYAEKGVYECSLYDGAKELLRKLKENGAVIALATSKPTIFAKQILDMFEITDCFDEIVGCELDGTRDSKNEVIEEVLKRLDISGEKCNKTVMIGDRNFDILGGKHFSLKTIGLELGFAPEGELEECAPDFIAKDYKALENYIFDEP